VTVFFVFGRARRPLPYGDDGFSTAPVQNIPSDEVGVDGPRKFDVEEIGFDDVGSS